MDTNSTESTITTRSAELTLKKKNKRARNRANKRERQRRVDQELKNDEAPKNEESSVEDVASSKNSEAQLLPASETGTESAKPLFEINAVGKRRRKKRRVIEASNEKSDVPSNPSPLDNMHIEEENSLNNPNIASHESVSSETKATEALSSNPSPLKGDVPPTELAKPLFEINAVGKRKKKKRRVIEALNKEENEEKNGDIPSNRCLLTHESVSPKTKGTGALSSNLLDVSVDNFPPDKSDGRVSAECCSERAQLAQKADMHVHLGPPLKRKLLILDVNGLLADIVNPPPKDCNPDACFWRRAIFKRPFCDDFLKFCFEKFDVAIWSSRCKKIIDKVVDCLLGNLQHKLLFCWDMSHSTQTGFKTLENQYKPLVCKELSKVWDRYDPDLPWKRGDYDESNTLLLDDSPYKALLNPANTAIYPVSYNFQSENDTSLGPGGDLRVYLEELSKADHVQKYVEQHPFGQRGIDDTSSDWKFYSDVLSSLSGQSTTHLHFVDSD